MTVVVSFGNKLFRRNIYFSLFTIASFVICLAWYNSRAVDDIHSNENENINPINSVVVEIQDIINNQEGIGAISKEYKSTDITDLARSSFFCFDQKSRNASCHFTNVCVHPTHGPMLLSANLSELSRNDVFITKNPIYGINEREKMNPLLPGVNLVAANTWDDRYYFPAVLHNKQDDRNSRKMDINEYQFEMIYDTVLLVYSEYSWPMINIVLNNKELIEQQNFLTEFQELVNINASFSPYFFTESMKWRTTGYFYAISRPAFSPHFLVDDFYIADLSNVVKNTSFSDNNKVRCFQKGIAGDSSSFQRIEWGIERWLLVKNKILDYFKIIRDERQAKTQIPHCIVVQRRKTRVVKNMDELIKRLQTKIAIRLVELEDMSFTEQLQMFSRSKCLIAAHVFELTLGISDWFWTMAKEIESEYVYLEFHSKDFGLPEEVGMPIKDRNFIVDIDRVEEALTSRLSLFDK
ncbi:hypothetical protein ROZALSC1DRAFT_26610 [Rozella allomycis CSF55]|uniref:Glycosyltransferase 61 catalytic domain-containing protein n=1 Tax=Rozella allomycis (strain CSF55) TaxID=988480 RepID=A0A075B2Z3_ROZAC|nr:hypothetical protein O9G_001380 [Rozella allomycis CSF55]RKP21986.1 hypothetical protein ROZALSC1DRAFT_26610 [Rozella allomycis CSF55]|eukprot:EPZ36935.1 hypothetical protein O9G_001380 [Rozella allomycis CSF55]